MLGPVAGRVAVAAADEADEGALLGLVSGADAGEGFGVAACVSGARAGADVGVDGLLAAEALVTGAAADGVPADVVGFAPGAGALVAAGAGLVSLLGTSVALRSSSAVGFFGPPLSVAGFPVFLLELSSLRVMSAASLSNQREHANRWLGLR